MRVTADGLAYPNKYYWDINRNPYASILNGLADCTCYVFGAILEDGHRPIISQVRNANTFHLSLINGWSRIPFDENRLEEGDVLQWVKHCHVAMYVGNGNISGSFYTGIHGKAWWGDEFDKRYFTSLEQMSDWMIENYPKRFFHCWEIDEECRWCGGSPEYILKHPLYSVPEDNTRDQIKVLSDDMNVRDENNIVLKRAEKGFYNVLSYKDKTDYRWYEVETNKFIAGYPGRVEFIPSEQGEIVRLKKRILELENTLKEINRLSEVD